MVLRSGVGSLAVISTLSLDDGFLQLSCDFHGSLGSLDIKVDRIGPAAPGAILPVSIVDAVGFPLVAFNVTEAGPVPATFPWVLLYGDPASSRPVFDALRAVPPGSTVSMRIGADSVIRASIVLPIPVPPVVSPLFGFLPIDHLEPSTPLMDLSSACPATPSQPGPP